jgi:hypothetical protein
MVPGEMHDKIIQDQMKKCNDKRKSIKKEEWLPMGGWIYHETCTG